MEASASPGSGARAAGASAQASKSTTATGEKGGDGASLWSVVERAGAEQGKGKTVARLLQKHMLARVERMPLDEIEMLAGR